MLLPNHPKSIALQMLPRAGFVQLIHEFSEFAEGLIKLSNERKASMPRQNSGVRHGLGLEKAKATAVGRMFHMCSKKRVQLAATAAKKLHRSSKPNASAASSCEWSTEAPQVTVERFARASANVFKDVEARVVKLGMRQGGSCANMQSGAQLGSEPASRITSPCSSCPTGVSHTVRAGPSDEPRTLSPQLICRHSPKIGHKGAAPGGSSH